MAYRRRLFPTFGRTSQHFSLPTLFRNCMRTVEDFWHDFHQHAARAAQPGMPVLFRGEPEAGFPLVPSIARGTREATSSDISSLEDILLSEFRLAAAPIIESEPANEIEWVFLAQHYGVPTRLLDWSTNPMVALFFAVETHDEKDAVIYIADHQVTDQIELVDFRTASVKKEKQQGALRIFALQNDQGTLMFVRPKYTDRRYLNQRSVFSCPADPFTPLQVSEMKTLTIEAAWKPFLRQTLRTFGIVHSFIYPGLEGTAKEVRSAHFDPVKTGRLQMQSFTMQLNL
jgi:hypothetical protein